MGHQQSTIDTLPEPLKDQLNKWLRDKAITQVEAKARLDALCDEIGINRRSKSAINRYAVKMEEVGQQLRESREIAKMWIAELGSSPQNEVGKLINEIIQAGTFKLGLFTQRGEITEENAAEIGKVLKDMALTAMRLEKAANLNVEREKEIRQQAKEEAANSVDKIAKKGGLSKAVVQEIRKEILGIS